MLEAFGSQNLVYVEAGILILALVPAVASMPLKYSQLGLTLLPADKEACCLKTLALNLL